MKYFRTEHHRVEGFSDPSYSERTVILYTEVKLQLMTITLHVDT